MLLYYLSLVDSQEDKDKVGQLYNQYRKIMLHAAMKILKDEYRAEDAVHHAFVKIIQNINTIGDIFCPQTGSYCVILCRRAAIDMLRREHTNKYTGTDGSMDEIPDDMNIEEEIILKMDLENIINAVLRLPDIYRDIFYLYYSNGCSLKQIAKALSISNEAAKKRLQRARQQIITALQGVGRQ